MLVANAGAMFAVSRVLMPLGFIAIVAGRRSDKRRRSRAGSLDGAPSSAIDASTTKRPSRRSLRAELARGADARTLVLRRADLNGMNLSDVDLACVDLTGAHLRGANLSGADLTDAALLHADLSGADLRDAVLTFADLADCDLTGADLRGADLARARNASSAWLRKAQHSPSTRWPPHFDPAGAGAIARGD